MLLHVPAQAEAVQEAEPRRLARALGRLSHAAAWLGLAALASLVAFLVSPRSTAAPGGSRSGPS